MPKPLTRKKCWNSKQKLPTNLVSPCRVFAAWRAPPGWRSLYPPNSASWRRAPDPSRPWCRRADPPDRVWSARWGRCRARASRWPGRRPRHLCTWRAGLWAWRAPPQSESWSGASLVSGGTRRIDHSALESEIGNRVIVIFFSITITITIALIVCNCNSVRFFGCVIVIVLAFCYYRLLLPLMFILFFESLDLKYIYNNLQQCRKHTF